MSGLSDRISSIRDQHWSDYGFNLVAQRNVNFFQSSLPNDEIAFAKLPRVEFVVREHQIKDWPSGSRSIRPRVWSAATSLNFRPASFVERLDVRRASPRAFAGMTSA